MPPRTNLFQRVIATVYQHLSDEPVQESKMVPDAIAGTDREVDVMITEEVAGEVISIGVEATALGKKLALPAVDSLIAKHKGIGTSHLVIVSKSGFTKPALQRIEATHGVSGYQPKDVVDEKKLETKIVGKLAKLWPRRFSVTLTTVFAEIELPAALRGTNIASWTIPPPQFPLVDKKGKEVTSIEAVFVEWAQKNSKDVAELLDVGNTTVDTDKTFLKDLLPPWRVNGQETPNLYVMVNTNLEGEPATPEPLKLRKLDLRGPASVRVSEVDLRHQQLNADVAYTVGEGVLDGQSLLLVASATSKGEKVTTLLLGRADPRP